MQQNLLDQVKSLTKSDTKNLSQKVGKAVEELGELSAVALPYENAAGTLHRFVAKKEILEECVDNILCHLSIIYDLDFTDEEMESMMVQKLAKWQNLQLQEKGVTDSPIPYEVHVTVDMSQYDGELLDAKTEMFRNFCKTLEVKPIILDLHCKDRSVIKDVMTSSVYFGNNTGAMAYTDRLAEKLSQMGFKVVRKKIETVPWHPAAPQTDQEPMPKGSYFESHLAVICTEETEEALRALIGEYPGAHLSRNMFKQLNEGCYIMMVTLRHYDYGFDEFEGELRKLIESISKAGFEIEKEIVEFSIFDDKDDHDQAWLTH